MPLIESLNAVTFLTRDMARAFRFYTSLGFETKYGGETADFTSFRVGEDHLNLSLRTDGAPTEGWGRAIFYVADVDAMYQHALDAGLTPEFTPRDAAWGERYFHLRDPDGHELSFAKPIGVA